MKDLLKKDTGSYSASGLISSIRTGQVVPVYKIRGKFSGSRARRTTMSVQKGPQHQDE